VIQQGVGDLLSDEWPARELGMITADPILDLGAHDRQVI
jgi:hypothetical protein